MLMLTTEPKTAAGIFSYVLPPEIIMVFLPDVQYCRAVSEAPYSAPCIL